MAIRRCGRPRSCALLLVSAALLSSAACDADPTTASGTTAPTTTFAFPSVSESGSTWWDIPGRSNPGSSPTASGPTIQAPAVPGVPSGRVLVNARLDPTGVLSVTENITFLNDPGVHMLTISVQPSDAAGLTDDFSPRLQWIRAAVPGKAPLTVIDLEDSKIAFFPGNTRNLVLHYRLDGVMQQSLPSDSDRALIFLSGVDIAPATELSRTITVADANNMGCASPGETMRACGVESSGAWTVTLSPEQSDDSVYAQIDIDSTSG
jgi:hypothetical protein